jgi:hypothetical protein
MYDRMIHEDGTNTETTTPWRSANREKNRFRESIELRSSTDRNPRCPESDPKAPGRRSENLDDSPPVDTSARSGNSKKSASPIEMTYPANAAGSDFPDSSESEMNTP